MCCDCQHTLVPKSWTMSNGNAQPMHQLVFCTHALASIPSIRIICTWLYVLMYLFVYDFGNECKHKRVLLCVLSNKNIVKTNIFLTEVFTKQPTKHLYSNAKDLSMVTPSIMYYSNGIHYFTCALMKQNFVILLR